MSGSSEDRIKNQLQQMNSSDFEELVAEVWESEGYDTTVTKGSGDRGIDVEATRELPVSQLILIQAKRYTEGNKLGSDDVRTYATLYQQEPDADSVVIVTSGSITSEAKSLADDLNVKLLDGDSLAKIVAKSQTDLFSLIGSQYADQTKQAATNKTSTSQSVESITCPDCQSGKVIQKENIVGKCTYCGKKFWYDGDHWESIESRKR